MSDAKYRPVAAHVGAGQDPSAIELADCEAAAVKSVATVKSGGDVALKANESLTAVGFGVVLYAFCSSTLLVINKVSVHLVPDPSFVLFCQFLASSLAVRAIKVIYPDTDIELLKWEKAKPFFAATLIFYICLFTNTAALKHVNVETVIVVRSCSPIAVALLEKLTLGKALPNIYGCGALLMIAGGATLYVMTDDGFQVRGYIWLAAYFVSIVTEMVFVKFIVETVPMSTWTRVYYNNTLSLPLAALTCAVNGNKFLESTWSAGALGAIWTSCIVGVAISYAGFNLRKLVSATTFTVVGVVCKIITVLINDVIWTQHSNALGHLALGICIFAGWLFEKAKKW
eukprot:TRINITY_DN325_c0_g4_i1.p1 TRINITY_DN325_c0_g4~~TRINITY_DN325_c0_g4_i1.p1  ORF type:complete len:342 (-),score=69.55 TRINITY_DN325_c0_g4_i1:286-1311(-)